MSYDTSIPRTGDSASQDYLGMQANFNQIQNSFSVNHKPLATGGGVDGYHTQIQLADVLAGDPNKVAPVSSVYTKGTPPELFFQNGDLASNVIQLTSALVNDGSNGTVAAEYTVTTPFGMVLKFGLTQAVATGSVITLVSPFATTFLGLVITPRLATFCQSGANISGSPSQFTVYFSTGGNQNLYFFAWGN